MRVDQAIGHDGASPGPRFGPAAGYLEPAGSGLDLGLARAEIYLVAGKASSAAGRETACKELSRELSRQLSRALAHEGYRLVPVLDGRHCLGAVRARPPAGILLDLDGPHGLETLRALAAERCPAPVLALSSHGVPMAVAAMRCGATDVIETPAGPERIVRQLREVLGRAVVPQAKADGPGSAHETANETAHETTQETTHDPAPGSGAPRRLEDRALTGRERDVLVEIAAGASNKEAGRTLGISPRTVEVHRARIMAKLGARNTADLVRIVLLRGAG